MGGCQNYGPFLGTLNIRCRIIIGTQKGTIILTTTQILYRCFTLEEPRPQLVCDAEKSLGFRVFGHVTQLLSLLNALYNPYFIPI